MGTRLQLTLQGSQQSSGSAARYVPKGSQLKLNIRLDRNGRTVVYGGSRPEGAPAAYRYSRTRDRYNGRNHRVGRLFLDYGSVDSSYGGPAYGDHRLFFQRPQRGFYKSIDYQKALDFRGTSWGVFRIRCGLARFGECP